jgi:hypothetical protein
MSKRRWFEQADTLEVRLAEEATRLRDKAELFSTRGGSRGAATKGPIGRNRLADERMIAVARLATAEIA